MSLKIGIHITKSSTTSVLADDHNNVIAWAQCHSSQRISTCLYEAIERLLASASVDPASIDQVMLCAPYNMQALTKHEDLLKVCIIRITPSAGELNPPLLDWPQALQDSINGPVIQIPGGHEYDGTECSPLNQNALRLAIREVISEFQAVAITSTFSMSNHAHELQAKEICRQELGNYFPITCSYTTPCFSFYDRENSAVLNASLYQVGQNILRDLKDAMRLCGITNAISFFIKNNGTLMLAEKAIEQTIYTFGSSLSTTIFGAAKMAGKTDAVVVIMNNDAVHIGSIINGVITSSCSSYLTEDIYTNFEMPHTISVPFSQASVVYINKDSSFTIGPQTVKNRMFSQSIVYGGNTLTLLDIAVRLGYCNCGDAKQIRPLSKTMATAVYDFFIQAILDKIDYFQPSAVPLPVIVVGDAARIFIPPQNSMYTFICPDTPKIVGAFGSASLPVGSTMNMLFSPMEKTEDEMMGEALGLATELCLQNGARPTTIHVEQAAASSPSYSTLINEIRVKVIGEPITDKDKLQSAAR